MSPENLLLGLCFHLIVHCHNAGDLLDQPEGKARVTPMSLLGRVPGLSTALMFRPVRLLPLLGYLWPPRRFIAARSGAQNVATVSIYRG
jgi:hypothetical protein